MELLKIEDIAIKYKEDIESNLSYSKHTKRAYLSSVRIFVEFSDKEELEDINDIDIHFLKKLFKFLHKDVKISTASNRISGIEHFFKFATLMEYLKVNKFSSFKNAVSKGGRMGNISNKKPAALSLEEVDMLLLAVREDERPTAKRNYMLIRFALDTGLRVSEIANVTIKDMIDFVSGTSQLKVVGKGNKQRLLDFDLLTLIDEYKAYIDEIATKNISSGFIFQSQKRGKLSESAIYRIINNYLFLAGISDKGQSGLHILRHTFATNKVTMSGDIYKVSKILGHGSVATTEHYLH